MGKSNLLRLKPDRTEDIDRLLSLIEESAGVIRLLKDYVHLKGVSDAETNYGTDVVFGSALELLREAENKLYELQA